MKSRVPRRFAWATDYFQVAVTLAQLLTKAFVTIAALRADVKRLRGEVARQKEWLRAQEEKYRDLEGYNAWLLCRGMKWKDYSRQRYPEFDRLIGLDFHAPSLLGQEVVSLAVQENRTQIYHVEYGMTGVPRDLHFADTNLARTITRSMYPYVLAALVEVSGDKAAADRIRAEIDRSNQRYSKR